MNAEPKRDPKTGRLLPSGVSLTERFWAKVEKTDGCWLWRGRRESRGYGHFTVSASRRVGAHRFAWELTHGPVPAGMSVCHRCDNPPCVNPAHLFLGTTDDNMQDRKKKGRYASITGPNSHWFGKSKRGHGIKLTAAQVEKIRSLKGPGWNYRLKVAAQFGLSQAHVWRIWKGQCW